MRRSALLILLCAVTIVAACGGPSEVGSKKLLDFDQQKGNTRLGQGASPTTAAANAQSPAPQQQAPPEQKPAEQPKEEKFFDVAMVADSPYFDPGSQLVMSASLTLRVTNKDSTAERPTRTFTSEDHAFDSGALRPGQVWTYKFKGPGSFRITDPNAPFISATLEVR